MNWNEYFMNIADAVKLRSKDPNTKVGCTIRGQDNHVVATGFNGFPPGMIETDELWERPTKYTYVVHAEANAIIHSIQPLKGTTLYTTLFPCSECAKLIAAAGIKQVYYKDDKYKNDTSLDIFQRCNITIEKL